MSAEILLAISLGLGALCAGVGIWMHGVARLAYKRGVADGAEMILDALVEIQRDALADYAFDSSPDAKLACFIMQLSVTTAQDCALAVRRAAS